MVERRIRESGIAYTFLRPNLFMQGLLLFAATVDRTAGSSRPPGDARISVVDVRDNAAAAAAALTEPGHDGRVYDLTGPDALTHAELAASISAAVGRPIAFVDIPPEAMRDALLDLGMPVWQADGLIEDYAHYRRGEAAAITSGVQDATGKPPRAFSAFAREHARVFS